MLAGLAALTRITSTGRRVAPLAAAVAQGAPTITVVVPARDEALRLAPLLSALAGAPGVGETIVVDDESADGTGEIAASMGVRVVRGEPLPPGWAGKAWAMDQGLRAASGDWVVFLDADTRPDVALPSALVARAGADGLDLVTVAGRFECPTAALTWLHPAMLTTLVYRYGPPGAARARAASGLLANGQCMAARRDALLCAGGLSAVAAHTVEDVALVRHLAATGWRIGFLDASALLTVRMYETAGEAWRGWGRSLALPGVDRLARQLAGLGVVIVAQALPLARLVARRADVLDAALLAMRLGTLAGTASAYEHRGPAYWVSPAADVLAAAALARGIVAKRQRWRGREYAR